MHRPTTTTTTALAAWMRARALRLLARREHSRHELRGKLVPGQAQEDTSGADDITDAGCHADIHSAQARAELDALRETLLDELERLGLLSDERAADTLVHSRQQRAGVRRITQDLRRKGIPETAIARATADLHTTEHTRAQALLAKRWAKQRPDPSRWAREFQFLLRRGFSPDTARHVLAGWGKERLINDELNE
jgi:regulatory protein